MSNKYISFRDGGKSNEEALSRLLSKVAGTSNGGRIGSLDFKVKQNGTTNMTVLVTAGDFVIPYLDYFFHAWSTVDQSVTISPADASNGRIDRLVAYIDLAVVSSATTNNLDAVKFANVAGTPSGSPAAVNDAAVQAAVGGGNPWKELARITVDATVTSIVDAKISDTRTQFILGGGVGGAESAVRSSLAVFNDVCSYWLAPKAEAHNHYSTGKRLLPPGHPSSCASIRMASRQQRSRLALAAITRALQYPLPSQRMTTLA